MRFDLANLPRNVATLHRIIARQAADVASEREARAASEAELAAAKAGLLTKTLEVEKLKLQIARLRRKQFGRSSEKIARKIEQLELILEELEAEASAPSPAATPEASAPNSGQPSSSGESNKSKRSGRKPPPEHLPRREVVHEPSCTCPSCGGEMRKVGEDVTEILDYVPGHFEVIKHIRPAFSCRRCESMVQNPMPSLPIERGQPGAGLLAHVLVGKYCDHLPLYRQSGIYAREGVELDRATLADWVGKAAALVSPWSRLSPSMSWRPTSCMLMTRRYRFWRPAPARPRPDACGSICATSGLMAVKRRRRLSIAILPIARASIRARNWPNSAASCRPTAIPVLASSIRAPTGNPSR